MDAVISAYMELMTINVRPGYLRMVQDALTPLSARVIGSRFLILNLLRMMMFCVSSLFAYLIAGRPTGFRASLCWFPLGFGIDRLPAIRWARVVRFLRRIFGGAKGRVEETYQGKKS